MKTLYPGIQPKPVLMFLISEEWKLKSFPSFSDTRNLRALLGSSIFMVLGKLKLMADTGSHTLNYSTDKSNIHFI
jgi:hypothetical protein